MIGDRRADQALVARLVSAIAYGGYPAAAALVTVSVEALPLAAPGADLAAVAAQFATTIGYEAVPLAVNAAEQQTPEESGSIGVAVALAK